MQRRKIEPSNSHVNEKNKVDDPPFQKLKAIGYGSISFPGTNQPPAKWVAVNTDADVKNLENVFFNVWMLTPPCSILSILGPLHAPHHEETLTLPDGEPFDLKRWLDVVAQPTLSRAIERAAKMSKAWVISRGLVDTVLSTVGRSLRGKVPCIGFAPWKLLAERKNLEAHSEGSVHYYVGKQGSDSIANHSVDHSTPVTIQDYDSGGSPEAILVSNTKNASSDTSSDVSQELESHHTHFVFVNSDGNSHREGDTRKMRAAVRQSLSVEDKSGDGVITPQLFLVVNGDMATLEMVHDALVTANSIGDEAPVVFFPQSGGFARDMHIYWKDGKLPSLASFAKDNANNRNDAYYKDYVAKAAELFPKIKALGVKQDQTGEAGERPSVDFILFNDHVSNYEDDAYDGSLEFDLMDAILSGCRSTKEKILLAITWGNQDILQRLLEGETSWKSAVQGSADAKPHESRKVGRLQKGLALEVALQRHDHSLTEMLISFAAEASNVRPWKLFSKEKKTWDSYGVLGELFGVEEIVAPGDQSAETRASRRFKPQTSKKDLMVSDDEMIWMKLLEKLVDDYAFNFHARMSPRMSSSRMSLSFAKRGADSNGDAKADKGDAKSDHCLSEGVMYTLSEAVKPTWTDLFMLSALTGSMDLSRVLWRKSLMPLRAAVMASELCNSLTLKPICSRHLEELKEHAALFESFATDILDGMVEKDAMQVLVLVASESFGPQRLKLWPGSPFDNAIKADGKLSFPCKQVVAHKHAEALVESYFCGDFPKSKARIYKESSFLSIFLQIIFLVIPGTFCEVSQPSDFWYVEQAVKDQNYSEDPRRKQGRRGSINPFTSAVKHDKSFGSNEDGEFEPWAIEQRTIEQQVERLKRIGETVWKSGPKENSVADVLADLFSGRFLWFLAIPKVKFVLFLIFQVIFMALPVLVVWNYDTAQDPDLTEKISGDGKVLYTLPVFDLANGPTDRRHAAIYEVLFWCWAILRFSQEFEELCAFMPQDTTKSFTKRAVLALRYYSGSFWNQVDILTACIVLAIMVLRLRCRGELGICAEALCNKENEGEVSCTDQQIIARGLYAVAIVLIWLRLLQTMRIHKGVGILSIIFGCMLEDVAPFVALFAVICPAFGLALGALSPGTYYPYTGTGEPEWFNQVRYFRTPFWSPWWGLLGDFRVDYISIHGVPVIEWLVPLLTYIYLFLTLVVLINLLIAVMSQTYVTILEVNTQEWVYEKALLVIEYKDQKMFPPPFNIILYLWKLLVLLWRMCKGKAQPESEHSDGTTSFGFSRQVPRLDELRLQGMEHAAMEAAFAKQAEERSHEQTPAEVARTLKRELEAMKVQLEENDKELKSLNKLLRAQFESTTGQQK